jgi:hypothetical protein
MHQGTELGRALKEAMDLKGVKQDAVAAAFGIKQPSVSEWTKHGRIAKKHLPLLVSYFLDVVGPEHWGLPAAWGGTEVARKGGPAALTGDEHDLLAAYRLLDAAGKADLRAKAVQLALEQQPAIAQMMEMAGVSRRADDSAVLSWWHRTQERVPREIHEGPAGKEGGLVGGERDIEQQKADQ